MIDIYYWPTPNGWKITIAAEEMNLPYEIKNVDISIGDQFKPEFLSISPNNRMPAIVDHEPKGGGAPISVFESGAILVYLAEKTGLLLSTKLRQRTATLEWVFWQMGGLGPMLGQAHHFRGYAPESIQYAIDRYTNEANRLYGVLNRRLADREYICDEYSIADIACWPWCVLYEKQGQTIEDFPHIARWLESIQARPTVKRGFEIGREEWDRFAKQGMTKDAKEILFGQKSH